MAQASTNEIRPGMKVEVDGDPYLVISNEFVKPGKGQAFNRIKIKNILTNRVVEKTYKSGEKLDLADVEEIKMRYLYGDADHSVFMNDNTFDQIEVQNAIIESKKDWIKEDQEYELILYKGNIVDLLPPTFMDLKITRTDPGARGDSSGRVMKPATLETGAQIQIPIFIEEGERIKVDTRTGEYVSRSQ